MKVEIVYKLEKYSDDEGTRYWLVQITRRGNCIMNTLPVAKFDNPAAYFIMQTAIMSKELNWYED
jgi:hypothetical protein